MKLNHFLNSKIHLFILSLFLCLNNCGGNSQGGEFSENLIEIQVAPIGKQPQIFLQPGGTKICRRGLPDESIYNLTRDEVETLTEETSSGEGESSGESSEQPNVTAQRNQVITTDVEAAWFEMGLVIGNRSDKYFLRINQLIFNISAKWGTEGLSGRIELTSGSYCQSDPLYIITPIPRGSKKPTALQYLPYKKNYPNNLILYVSGVPLPEGPPKRDGEEGESEVMDNIRADLDNQAPQQNNEQFVLTYLPTYRVSLVLLGQWIDRDRNPKANFQKTIRFTLTSQFLN